MTTKSSTEVVVTRRFDAPLDAVFGAWLDPAAVGLWLFRADTGQMTRVDLDPRVGGTFTIVERRGDMPVEHRGTFIDIERARRIVFAFSTSHAVQPTGVTVEFTPAGSGCIVTLTHELDPTWAGFADRVQQGWAGILDGLAAMLAAGPGLMIIRSFDAPASLVWQAWTDPHHLRQWICPTDFVVTFAEGDLRPGGRWRSGMRGPDGRELIVTGEYREIAPPDRLSFTHAWETAPGVAGHESLVSVTLSEAAGRTTMTFTQTAMKSLDSRNGHVGGWSESFIKLAAALQPVTR